MPSKQHVSASRTSGRSRRAATSEHEAAADNSVALAPPGYGIDFIDGRDGTDAPAQLVGAPVAEGSVGAGPAPSPSPNETGLPDDLKAGLERLSGMSMDHVRVHRNSARPAQLNALAYAQGSDIHVAPGQERHLPHEAWHVVQQSQGRVKPTMQLQGDVPVNDDEGLEREADVMGKKALQLRRAHPDRAGTRVGAGAVEAVVQRNVGFEFELDPTVKTFRSGRLWGHRPLVKNQRVMNGVDFYVEADGLAGGETSWEFVTTDFPETYAGLQRLIQALSNIDGLVERLRQSPRSGIGNAVYNPVNNAFAAGFAQPVADRYFTTTTQTIMTKPQVTAGFALDALDEMFHSASTAAGAGVSDMIRSSHSMNIHGQVGAANLDVPLGQMRTEAGNAIAAALGAPANPALRGLVTQLMQIIVAGRQNIGVTPKTILRLALGRSDMKAAFNTLPALVRNPLQAAPNQFEDIVMDAVDAHLGVVLPRGGAVISGNLFTDPSYALDPRANMASPFLQVTRRQWLRALATPGQQDLLSKGHYPVRRSWGVRNKTDVKANMLLDSMGALHGALDPGNRPVFEIRSSRQILAPLITAYALDFFKYVRFLHNPALTESAELTGLALADVASIVGFSPNRALLLNQMRQRARAGYNA